MTVKFYRKVYPRQKFYLSSGEYLQFDPIDHMIGVAAITDAKVMEDIAKATSENRGGIEEISAEEYHALQSKKKENLQPPWREELSRGQTSGLTTVPLPSSDPVAAVVGAGADRAEKVTRAAEAAKPTPRKKK
jgi:hypothetical protein